jgi:hypothetical protein
MAAEEMKEKFQTGRYTALTPAALQWSGLLVYLAVKKKRQDEYC